MQTAFFNYIKATISVERSIIEEIADVLDINYDAAYRRVNNKTTLTIDETVILARHYKISLNKLFEVGSQLTLIAEKSPKITDCAGLEAYFKSSLLHIEPLTKLKSASIVYSAKDIPLFYTLQDSLLTRYKMYVWLKFLNEDEMKVRTTFEDFLETIPKTLLESAYRLGETYNYINITEFWNDNTINGTLQQIFYYYESSMLSKANALLLCEDLKHIVDHVERQTIQQTIINSKNTARYSLYKSDLLTMSNTVMVKTQYQKVFFTPFTVLTYFKIQHPPTCDEMDEFFTKQMSNSKLLANAGEKDRTLFFNMMLQKIDTVIARININKDLIIF